MVINLTQNLVAKEVQNYWSILDIQILSQFLLVFHFLK